MNLIDAALDLAAAGWPVFPLAGKVPRIPKTAGGRGHKDGTVDPEQIRRWWGRWPKANIGARVPDSLVVVDVDPRHRGDTTLAHLEDAHGPLPATLTAFSGRGDGGKHLYFRHPGGAMTGTRLGSGLDLKAGGAGYVVVPPSLHPDTSNPYWWAEPHQPAAAPPPWLVMLLRPEPPRRRPAPTVTAGRGYGPGAVASEASRVAAAPNGDRNETLNRAAFRLGQLVAAGHTTALDVTEALAAAAASCGLPTEEAEQTIASGLEAGQKNPRSPQ